MENKQKKNPFSPIELEGADVDWFSAYLGGKIVNKRVEEKRRETLEKASKIEEGKPVHV